MNKQVMEMTLDVLWQKGFIGDYANKRRDIKEAITILLSQAQKYPDFCGTCTRSGIIPSKYTEQAGEVKEYESQFTEKCSIPNCPCNGNAPVHPESWYKSSPEKEQSGDNIGRCKVCGNILQKEGCPVCHQAGEGKIGITKDNFIALCERYKKYQYWRKLAVNREVEIKRYREALQEIANTIPYFKNQAEIAKTALETGKEGVE